MHLDCERQTEILKLTTLLQDQQWTLTIAKPSYLEL